MNDRKYDRKTIYPAKYENKNPIKKNLIIFNNSNHTQPSPCKLAAGPNQLNKSVPQF